jgi:hypothetical protein
VAVGFGRERSNDQGCRSFDCAAQRARGFTQDDRVGVGAGRSSAPGSKQISFGNDRKKSKGKGESWRRGSGDCAGMGRAAGPSAALRMTSIS